MDVQLTYRLHMEFYTSVMNESILRDPKEAVAGTYCSE